MTTEMTLIGVATVTVPTAFGQWALDNGLTSPQMDGSNPGGIPYGMLFVLDLPANAGRLPINVSSVSDEPRVQIELPATGLPVPLNVEYKASLSDLNWVPLPSTYFDEGPNALAIGQSGLRTFRFPSGSKGFIRFSVAMD